MEDLLIRWAGPGDRDIIAKNNRATAKETENIELDEQTSLLGVSAVFNNPSRGFYLLAESDGVIVGQLMITYEWSDWRNGLFWWIQSVFVDPAWREKGVFSSLYGYLKEKAEEDPEVCGLRLYVFEKNDKAQKVYADLGMERPGYELYEVDFTKL